MGATLRGRPALWIVPCIVTGTTITSLGTPIAKNRVTEYGPAYAKSAEASSAENLQITYANGVVGEASKINKTVHISDGTEKTSGGSGGDVDKISATLEESEKFFSETIAPLRGDPVIVCVPTGENITGADEGFHYLLGVLASEIDLSHKGEEVLVVQLEFSGKAYSMDAATDTALAALAWTAVTPVGEADPITPTALAAGDITNLKKGELVFKVAA